MRKKVLFLVALVLALVFSIPMQQTFAEENEYVYPTIEFDAIKLNATAYRLHNGDTLNFTFTFTTQEGVLASYPEHYTDYSKTEKTGHLNITCYLDGRRTRSSYRGLGVEGSGTVWNENIQTVRKAGDHTIEYNWLFTIDEDAEGYLDINFLTEVKLKLERLPTSPFPTQSLLLAGVVGGVCVAVVGAVFFVNKRHSKRPKEEP